MTTVEDYSAYLTSTRTAFDALASAEFEVTGDSITAICVEAALVSAIAAGLAWHDGEIDSIDEFELPTDVKDLEWELERASCALEGLVRQGLIDPTAYEWDDDARTVRLRSHS